LKREGAADTWNALSALEQPYAKKGKSKTNNTETHNPCTHPELCEQMCEQMFATACTVPKKKATRHKRADTFN